MDTMNYTDDVFKSICKLHFDTYDISVVFTKSIVIDTGLTMYKVRKALKKLQSMGLVEKRTEYIYGEVDVYTGECYSDPHPPITGFAITDKGFESEAYKEEYSKHVKSYKNWSEW